MCEVDYNTSYAIPGGLMEDLLELCAGIRGEFFGDGVVNAEEELKRILSDRNHALKLQERCRNSLHPFANKPEHDIIARSPIYIIHIDTDGKEILRRTEDNVAVNRRADSNRATGIWRGNHLQKQGLRFVRAKSMLSHDHAMKLARERLEELLQMGATIHKED